MRAHIIENGHVVNTVIVDSLGDGMVDAAAGGNIGDKYENGVFTKQPKTREELKAERQAAVDAIKVTTQAGHTFDGDETSQERMSRAIIALNAASALGLGSTVNWVLADNTVIQASAAELTEALVLAGQAQAAIWVI